VTAPSPTRHRLTSRFSSALLLTFVLFYAAAVSGSSWFLLLAGAVAGLGAASLPARARLDGLVVQVDHPPRVSAGDPLTMRVSVANEGRRTSSAAAVVLHTPGLEDVAVSVGRLDPGAATSAVLSRASERRGVAEATSAVLVTRPALGLRVAVRELSLPGRLVVHPGLRHRSDQPVTRRHQVGEQPAGMTADGGSEVVGVREWRTGDDPARVHWRSTARSGRLTLLERSSAEVEELRVVLVGSDRHPGFEEALSDAATVCDRGLRSGSTVTAVAWHVDGPVLGAAGSPWDLLDWWSTVHDTVLPDAREFGRTALAGFGPGDLLVAGPPEADPAWLRAASASCPGLRLRRLAAA
jgi:uncharacterized protein (DUF58 family)